MKRILFFLTLLLLTVQFAFAQTTYTGCVLYDNSGNPITSSPIYTVRFFSLTTCGNYSVERYSPTTLAKNLNNYCSISPPLATALAIGGNKNYRDCSVNGVCGIVRTIRVVECPIDGLEVLLLVASTFFGSALISPTFKSKLLYFKKKWLK